MEKTNKTNYDVIVIGAGSAGLTAAVGFKNIGKSVLLIERDTMGGECTNTGCIPSKSLLHQAKQYHHAKQISSDSSTLDTYREQILSTVRSTIDSILEHETPEVFAKQGIDVIKGEAVFTGTNTISVGGTEYNFKTSVIASGSSPRMIDIPGLDSSLLLTNQNVFEQETIPKKLLIIGSGPIGMELGQACAMLGSSVTIATRDSRLAGYEEPEVSEIIERVFTDLGITTLYQSEITQVDGTTAIIETKTDTGTKTKLVEFDKVLVAIGRVPNIPTGLESAGVTSTKHGIIIDKHYRTTNKHIFASGDVSLRDKFTHTADNASRHIVKKVLLPFIPPASKRQVPKVTYTDPEIASVGLSWNNAVKQYGKNKIVKLVAPYSTNDRALTDQSTETGVAIIIAKKISGRIIGANITGQSAGEILSTITLAMDNKISLWKINKMIFPYPTISLIIKKLSDKFLAYQLGNLKSDLINYFK